MEDEMTGNFKNSRFARILLLSALTLSLVLSISAFTWDINVPNGLDYEPPCEDSCDYRGIQVWCDDPCDGNRFFGAVTYYCCNPCSGCYYWSFIVCTEDYWGYCN